MFKPLDTELPNLALYLTNVGREFLKRSIGPNPQGGGAGIMLDERVISVPRAGKMPRI